MRLTRTSSSMASPSSVWRVAEVFHAVNFGGIAQAADVFAAGGRRRDQPGVA